MTDNSSSSAMAAHSYAVAFNIGLVGLVILTLFSLTAPTLAGLLALFVWTLFVLFLLPWFVVCYYNREIYIPYHILKFPWW